MKKEGVRNLGIVAIIIGAMYIVLTIMFTILAVLVTPIESKTVIYGLFVFPGIFYSAGWIVGGAALAGFRNWGRILLIVIAIITLFQVPLGTIIGVTYLIFLFNKDVKKITKK